MFMNTVLEYVSEYGTGYGTSSNERRRLLCSYSFAIAIVLYHGYMTPLYHRHHDQGSWNTLALWTTLAPRALSVFLASLVII
jgi:hypothetical protein